MPKPEFVLNLAPQHAFAALAQWPEAQLLLLVPQAIWQRARQYVPRFEAAALAGRFGANPGEYEWEVLEQPQGFKWLRRTPKGDAAYCSFAVTAAPAADPVEVYGLIDVGSDSPWWFDAIEDMSPLLHQSDSVARSHGLDVESVRLEMSLDEYRRRELLTAEPGPGEPAWRIGDQAEVKRFRDALIGLLERARKANLGSTPTQ
jgi:hypothetical protein